MFIKNSNVFKCSETKRQFLSENIENSLCTQAILKTDFFFLIVLVKKNQSSFISEQNAAMPSRENSCLLFQPIVFFRF